MTHWAIMAVAGPPGEVNKLDRAAILEDYDKFEVFEMPDDYGEFPDTMDYENWEDVVLDKEDGATFPYMTKCMDCCLEFVNKRAGTANSLGYMNIEKTVHWPKFGGTIFAVTGHVTAQPMILKKGAIN